MAKTKAGNTEAAEVAAAAAEPQLAGVGVALLVRDGAERPGYKQNRVDGRLTLSQRDGWERIRAALDEAGARLDNGRRVTTVVDAVRWLGEHAIGKAAGPGFASAAPAAPDPSGPSA